MLYAFGMSPVGITILHDIFNDWKYVNGGLISFQYHYNYGQCISFDVSKLDPEHLGTFPANYENEPVTLTFGIKSGDSDTDHTNFFLHNDTIDIGEFDKTIQGNHVKIASRVLEVSLSSFRIFSMWI